jgi:hypothetical protein
MKYASFYSGKMLWDFKGHSNQTYDIKLTKTTRYTEESLQSEMIDLLHQTNKKLSDPQKYP